MLHMYMQVCRKRIDLAALTTPAGLRALHDADWWLKYWYWRSPLAGWLSAPASGALWAPHLTPHARCRSGGCAGVAACASASSTEHGALAPAQGLGSGASCLARAAPHFSYSIHL